MNKKLLFAAITGISLAGASALAEDVKIAKTIIDSAKLYENKENSVIQSFALTGRLQGDYFNFENDDGDISYEDALFRRFRFGVKAKVFGDFTIHAEMDLNANEIDDGKWDEIYNRLTDSYIKWSGSDISVKVGKQSAGFTLDGATSSKKLLAPERNLVAGNLWFGTEYFTGATIGGDINDFFYKVGGFSGSEEAEFGHFDNGYFGLLSGGTKLGNGKIRLDYVYSDVEDSDKWGDHGANDMEHTFALVHTIKLSEKFGIWSDLAYGIGSDDNGDLLGGSIKPFYDITDNFQLVLEYAGVTSLDNEADVKMSRYAYRNVGKTKVEEAHNLLAGLNWYLYGHKLKWQNAIEYNYGKSLAGTGVDYNGYGFTSALRLSW